MGKSKTSRHNWRSKKRQLNSLLPQNRTRVESLITKFDNELYQYVVSIVEQREFLHFFGTTRARNHFIYKVVCIIGEFERYVGELREKVKPYVDTFLKQCLQQQLTTADNERIAKGPLNRHLHYLARPNDFPYSPPDLVYTSKNTANFSRSLPISNNQSKMGQSLSKENANLIQEGSSNCNLNNSAEERCYALLERLTEGFNTGIFDDDDEDPFDGNENHPATSSTTKDSASIQIDATSSTQPMANTSTETEASKEKRNHGGEAATNFRVDKQVARPY